MHRVNPEQVLTQGLGNTKEVFQAWGLEVGSHVRPLPAVRCDVAGSVSCSLADPSPGWRRFPEHRNYQAYWSSQPPTIHLIVNVTWTWPHSAEEEVCPLLERGVAQNTERMIAYYWLW